MSENCQFQRRGMKLEHPEPYAEFTALPRIFSQAYVNQSFIRADKRA